MKHCSAYNLFLLLFFSPIIVCGESNITLEVTASAYTSHINQTSEDPRLTAWGDVLTPNTKGIAVSRDLIELGLDHNMVVNIEGLPGKYIVLDKMNERWKNKIDIYMGEDVLKAKQWGEKTIVIKWKK
jgi:3D (Asp-Asp-Asp) domain-containing protein